MTHQEIFDKLKARFNEAILELKSDKPVEPYITVSPDKVIDVCLFLRDDEDMHFDFLNCLSGTDNNDGTLSSVYHLYSFVKSHKIIIKVTVPKEKPDVATVSGIWIAAEWHEREAFDLIGINFTGHKDLRRILLPYDWDGHPLRKDYEVPEFYQGMKVPY